jgi:Mrr N-terminal domain
VQRIDLSDQTYQRLLARVESFSDTPEMVITRLLNQGEADVPTTKLKKPSRPADGELLPESDYWLPILDILRKAGGRAKGRDVIDALGERIGSLFGPADHDVLEMGEIRWRNRARFARLRMKELGLVSSESPRGIWEITEKGYDFLRAEGNPEMR